ncbi:MAG: hypothetical protein KDD34_08610 [Bdellovibrionales bacterium]|nr:hypothetical protein [Bdellovibrionales bacterium]
MKPSLVLLLSTLILTACQGNDPLKREANPYPDAVENDLAVKPEEAATQDVKVKSYDVSVDGEVSAANILHFITGETSSYTIHARSFISQTNFTLKAVNLPKGAELKPVGNDNSEWVLTWTPPVTSIPKGQQGVDFDASIEFIVLEGTSPRAAFNHAIFEKQTPIRLTVRHSDEQPVILSSDELDSKKIINDKSGKITFSITLVDPKSTKEFEPEIMSRYNANRSSQSTLPADFAIFPSSKKAEYLGSGKWKVYLDIDTTLLGWYYKNQGEKAKSINISFEIVAKSQMTENISPAWSKTLTLDLKQEAQ